MATTDDLLTFDPLDAAEQITGESYKCDEGTSALGFLLALQHNQVKNERLMALGDTTLQNDLVRYTDIIKSLGFELVLDLPFTAPGWNPEDPARNEHYFIYAHRDGLLLAFDTYDETRVNGGKVYYCWKPGVENYWGLTSSGSMYLDDQGEKFWGGDHDCREAIKHKLGKLWDNGTFYAQWPKGNRIFLWLLHYRDTRTEGYDYEAINAERIVMLPDWVRTMINR